MQVKVFHAFTMQEAIQAIKAELGPDAVILSTKDVRQRGAVAKWFGRPLIEVTAAIDDGAAQPRPVSDPPSAKRPHPAQEPAPNPALVPASRFQEALDGATHDALAPKLTGKRGTAPPAQRFKELRRPTGSPRLARVRDELRGLHQHLLETYPEDTVVVPKNVPGPMTVWYRDFVARGLAAPTAVSFVQSLHDRLTAEELRDAARVRMALRELVKQQMQDGEPLLKSDEARRVAVFFGPSGAGKTTAVAKLAARFTAQGRPVALITMDTCRASAVEQLRGYAAALDLPMEAAGTRDEAAQALRRYAGDHVVLIDTGGRSVQDREYLADVRWLTRVDHTVETHLVLSAATREEDLLSMASRCAEYGVSRLLATKLDETTGIGSLLTLHRHIRIPFSYFSTGPCVPHDMELASADRVADLLAGGQVEDGRMPVETLSKIVSESIEFEPDRASA